MHPWEGLITPEEIEIYRRRSSEFLKEKKLGQRPAVLVIGAQYNFTGEYSEPVAMAIAKYRFSCGEYAWASIPKMQVMLKVARAKGIPIVYTQDHELPPDPTIQEVERGIRIIDELAPQPDDKVFQKEGHSGFFCTQLPSFLISLGVDTVIVIGGATSGCVRATVTDSHDYRFQTFLVEECVFDRALTPHRCNLFDIAAKFASVVTLAEMTRMLEERDFKDKSCQQEEVRERALVGS